MLYTYDFEDKVKVNIWLEEIPVTGGKYVTSIKNSYKTSNVSLDNDRKISIEMQIMRHISSYVFICPDYRKCTDIAEISINISDYDGEPFSSRIALNPNAIHKGIPAEYAEGIKESIYENFQTGFLKCGIYEFYFGAHCEIGSSRKIFCILTNIVLRFLYLSKYDNESVRKTVFDEIRHANVQ